MQRFRTGEVLYEFGKDDGTERSLQVHWLEQYERRSGICSKTAPAYASEKYDLDNLNWKDVISIESAAVTF